MERLPCVCILARASHSTLYTGVTSDLPARIWQHREGLVRGFYNGEKVGEWRHHDERLTMFLLRNRRPRRYGKWIEQTAAVTLPIPQTRPDDDRPFALGDALIEISIRAPQSHGNELDDWGPDADDIPEQSGQ